VLFTLVLLLPFFYRTKKHQVIWVAFHASAAFSFLFDMGLEVQYGVFVYVFITFWWWKWFGVIQESFPKFAAS
jgi:O-antigen ligase